MILKWIVIIAATVNFGFMAFDGIRGLTKGDYIRPTTGEYAGQLGPWSKVVRAIGIDPESNLMKSAFVIWGIAGLLLTVFYAIAPEKAWLALVILSFASLWYLVPGTVLSLLQIILILISKYFI